MSKNIVIKLVFAGAAIFGVYKLYKAAEEYSNKINKHREVVLEEVEAELHEGEEMNKDIKDLTLNNTNLKPADRAFSYEIYKEKYNAIINAKSIKEIDAARKDFEDFYDILINVKDSDTIESLFKIYYDKKVKDERVQQEREAREAELDKYKTIGNVIEKIGSKMVCELVQ